MRISRLFVLLAPGATGANALNSFPSKFNEPVIISGSDSNPWYGMALRHSNLGLLIGSPSETEGSSSAEQTTVQTVRNNINLAESSTQRIALPIGYLDTLFGNDVACSADCSTVVIGAPGNGASEGGKDHGAAFIYNRNDDGAFIFAQRIVSPSPSEGAMFGATVSMDASGKVALVCSPFATVSSKQKAGECTLFYGPNFSTTKVITSKVPTAGAQFGGNDGSAAIVVKDDESLVIAIGAPGTSDSAVKGAVEIFMYDKSYVLLSQKVFTADTTDTTSSTPGDQVNVLTSLSKQVRFCILK